MDTVDAHVGSVDVADLPTTFLWPAAAARQAS
jgi:hypothetical protein